MTLVLCDLLLLLLLLLLLFLLLSLLWLSLSVSYSEIFAYFPLIMDNTGGTKHRFPFLYWRYIYFYHAYINVWTFDIFVEWSIAAANSHSPSSMHIFFYSSLISTVLRFAWSLRSKSWISPVTSHSSVDFPTVRCISLAGPI